MTRKSYLCLLLIVLNLAPELARGEIRFNKDIRPILSNKCFQCHGPDEPARKAKLRLDQAGGEHGAYRIYKGSQAIKPGDLEGSELWYRITTDDSDDHHAATGLPRRSARRLRSATSSGSGSSDGAEYEEFWAFVPPRDFGVPETVGPGVERPGDRPLRPRAPRGGRAQPRPSGRTGAR